MNFKELETTQKLRGGFYTERVITDFLVRWIAQIGPESILEPSCGDGAFFESLNQFCPDGRITACELDPVEVEKAASNASNRIKVLHTDFLSWYLKGKVSGKQFDAVVGNPPFIRYQYLPEEQQDLAERVFLHLRLPFTKHTNAWVPFVLGSLDLLRPGGRLAMVIPSEIFHIPHAQGLRTYLAERCSQVLIIDPQELWFEDTLQGTVLLLAEKAQPHETHHGVGVASVTDKTFLAGQADRLFQKTLFSNGTSTEGKWMKLFLTDQERSLLKRVSEEPKVKRFTEIAKVDVGIVTGANNFFLVPDSIVAEHGLGKWVHPMFGRSNHVPGIVFRKSDHARNKKAGLPANFVWLKGSRNSFSESVRTYLEFGEQQKLQARYKCRVREPWYTVPSVYVAPMAMLKRAHHFPRLVLNSAKAYTTDTAYRIRPLGANKAENLAFSFVNSLTLLTAELEGRHYGGGVLELVPSEIERLLIPLAIARKGQLAAADLRFRTIQDDSTFVEHQDAIVLRQIGIQEKEQKILFNAWNRLRLRRQRETSDEVKIDD
jgi:adenine-specific DNA-methyltransferase